MSSTSFTFTSSHSSSDSILEENINRAEETIHRWKLDDSRFVSIFHENNQEATVFFNCIGELHTAMVFLASNTFKSSSTLSVAQRLMQIAMKRLEKEFHVILMDNYKQQFSTIAISNLRLIADTMIRCGYTNECIETYKIARRKTIDEALLDLGIKSYTRSSVRKLIAGPDFDSHVKIWSNAVESAVKTVFHREKFLCGQVFTAHASIKNICFKNSTKDVALNLFTFPELIASGCKRLKSETIFLIMDLHNSISDLWPEIESIFSHETVSFVKAQALSSLHKLGDSVRSFLTKLESTIQKNSSKIIVTGGGIHPLNNSVMTYLSSLAEYGHALSDVIIDDLPFKEHSFLKSHLISSTEAVSVNFAWIILILLCKLDGKAKFHDYVALSYLFLVNNLHFIIEKVRVTNLKFILGDEWITNHETKLRQYVSSYESMSWNKVISCLPENVMVSPEKVRGCFRRLCDMFEEVYANQTSWIVVDEKMRRRMKASIANKLVPAYEEFYEKYLVTLSEDERCVKLLMKLSPENMAKCLSELFPGSLKV